ncbi:MAG: hypothetical protein CVV05_15515 [Gammaproteobacteria bacterium HGW-Gammaproteobacteria-1]|nr:MAG: hypothetical protein CVV05_15515 [Gammaproteobacteria bacterium HGW-Gammaproteobacteria-1]
MISLTPRPDRLAAATNLMPRHDGRLATRPGAVQVITGPVSAAQPWGNRILASRRGRLALWDGDEHDIAPAGVTLQATAFQTLNADAQREDRLYVADGLRPLWFLRKQGGAYQAVDVVNTITDAGGAPYPLPVPSVIANWRNRLWIGDLGNRLHHCQNEAPDEWDPLWTVEFQGKTPDRIITARPAGDMLAVGLGRSIWNVMGDSQYNWVTNPLRSRGVAGPDALASDDDGAWWVSGFGVFSLGERGPLTDDLAPLFDGRLFGASAVIDKQRRLLLVLVHGRVFAMHLAHPGRWTDWAISAAGLIATDDYVGWYGSNGVWLLGREDEPDVSLAGEHTDVVSVYETWDHQPNEYGRAHLPRAVIRAHGSTRGSASYTAYADNTTFSTTFSLSDESIPTWQGDVTGVIGQTRPLRPVRREFSPRLAGQSFRHRITAPCHIEIIDFEPQYRGGNP